MYSVQEELDAHHTEGGALMLLQEAHNALISLEAARPRIRTKKENVNLNSIQCYAPINAKDENTTRTFTKNCRHCVTH